ncbi:MAG: sulfotransferase, partial [Candidatus Binatia bacterium]
MLELTNWGLTKLNKEIERLLNRKLEPFITGLGQAYVSEWVDCPCVFVLSTGRVGTKTLTALLALSPQVVATHEPRPRLVKASFDAYMEGGDLGHSEKWRTVVLAARDDAVWEASRRGKIYVETNNRLTYVALALAVIFPASRFIHLHRHPYEFVRSAMRRGYYQGQSWDFARVRPRSWEPLAEQWAALSPLEKSAWGWARINAEAGDFLGTLPEARRLDVRAEGLFAGDEDTLRKLFAFVGGDFPGKGRIKAVLGRNIHAQRRGTFP